MAKKGKGSASKGARRERAVAVIQGYTDSAERIGADAALIGLIITLGFIAIMVGADPTGVAIFGLGGYALWVVTKFANAYLDVKRRQLTLDTTRLTRGQAILESHPDRQKRLFPPKEGGDRDGQ
jgi:hypothetical protein